MLISKMVALCKQLWLPCCMHHRPGGATRPHTTETGWNDLSGGSAEEGSSRVMLSPLLTWQAKQTRDSSGPSRPTRVMSGDSCCPNQSTPVIFCAPEHMATSSQRRTNTISYLACCIKTFIARNE